MKNFVKGVLCGVGIGMIIAPMNGEEMRRCLQVRFEELRGYLPENEEFSQYAQQISGRVSQTKGNLKDYTQQVVGKMKETGSDLNNLTEQAVSDIK